MDGLNSKERLVAFVEYKDFSNHAFEVMCGLANGYLGNKTTMPSTPVLEKVHAVFPELNMNWLLFGEGDMLIQKEDVSTSYADSQDITALLEENKILRRANLRAEDALFDALDEIKKLRAMLNSTEEKRNVG